MCVFVCMFVCVECVECVCVANLAVCALCEHQPNVSFLRHGL